MQWKLLGKSQHDEIMTAPKIFNTFIIQHSRRMMKVLYDYWDGYFYIAQDRHYISTILCGVDGTEAGGGGVPRGGNGMMDGFDMALTKTTSYPSPEWTYTDFNFMRGLK